MHSLIEWVCRHERLAKSGKQALFMFRMQATLRQGCHHKSRSAKVCDKLRASQTEVREQRQDTGRIFTAAIQR
ncbi:MAG: hypothetical protein XD66_0801 [Thermacetogenium phaeum]|jgi:hypothetical protein|uniref:Uncharacterized protein n=1 Tax=Thermacetogenium phaeum TaxID=85874 RepID=A0A101FGA6_9THEO|nr:MAG: hypothetical protein XD66_0801 [Thermacetogenium phaeum]